mgnify:CR=1 FL=1
MDKLWTKIMDKVSGKIADLTFLLIGLKSQCAGKVKADSDSKTAVNFMLVIDWSECTFAHLVKLAMRTVRIDEQAKMRKNGLPKEGEKVTVAVSEKQTKTVSLGRVSGMFEKLSDDDKKSFLEALKS